MANENPEAHREALLREMAETYVEVENWPDWLKGKANGAKTVSDSKERPTAAAKGEKAPKPE